MLSKGGPPFILKELQPMMFQLISDMHSEAILGGRKGSDDKYNWGHSQSPKYEDNYKKYSHERGDDYDWDKSDYSKYC